MGLEGEAGGRRGGGTGQRCGMRGDRQMTVAAVATHE